MTDETLASPVPALDATPAPEPAPTPEPEPVLTSAPDPTPAPELDPAPASSPVEVISVDELLERLQGEADEPQETQPPEETPPADPGDTLAVEIDPGTLAVLDRLSDIKQKLVQVSDQLADIQLHQTRPVLTTPFEDYTVMEGLLLLLLLLLAAFAAVCAKILRRGLSWLKS